MAVTEEDISSALENVVRNILNKILGERATQSPNSALEGSMEQWAGESPVWDVDNSAIPVKIMDTDKIQVTVPRAAQGWTGQHAIVDNTQVQIIAGSNVRRRAVTVVNQGSVNVAIDSVMNVRCGGPGQNGSPELRPGDAITLETTSEIYALGASSTKCDVMVYQIYDEGGSID